MDNTLSIETRTGQEGVTVLELSGRLDVLTCKELAAAIQQVVDEGKHNLALDLSKLEYVSSAGLRVLLQARKQLRVEKGSLALCGANEFVQDVLHTTGFTSIFPCHGSTADMGPRGAE